MVFVAFLWVGVHPADAGQATLGRRSPLAPALTLEPDRLDLGTVTVGDTASAPVILRNVGDAALVVHEMRATSPATAIEGAPGASFVLAPQESLEVLIRFAAQSGAAAESIVIQSNDPITPRRTLELGAEVRPLLFRTRLPAPPGGLPLGEAATILITPEPGVRIERGVVYYRTFGAPEFADSIALEPWESEFVAIVPGDRVAEAGLEYYVRVENSGVLATDPPGAPDAGVFYQRVSGATELTPYLSAENLPIGLDATIGVTLQAGAEFLDGTLYYRLGGAAVYDSIPLSLAASTFPVATVPGEFVGPRGLECRFRVQTLGGTILYPPDSPFFPGGFFLVRTSVLDLAEPTTHAGGRYRMVSIPLELDLPVSSSLEALLSDQLGLYDPTKWRSFRYLPDLGRYSEISTEAAAAGALRPEPGRAFWLVTRDPHRVDTAPVAGRSMPSDRPFHVTLRPGWNQIGNPFAFPIAWQDVACGPSCPDPPVRWNEAEGRYDEADVDSLIPFEGYWLLNATEENIDLDFPPHPGESPPVARVERADARGDRDWRVRIEAKRGDRGDSGNLAGVEASAAAGDDRRDRAEPPMSPESGVSLYFLGGTGPYVRKTVDLRAPIADDGDPGVRGWSWPFDVAITGDEASPSEVTLSFTELAGVPESIELRVVDRRLARTFDPRREPIYAYVGGSTSARSDPKEARFELRAGTREFVEAGSRGSDSTPGVTRLWPSFPNPVSTSAAIRFELARAGHVRIELHDVAGRRVGVIVDEDRAVGIHEVVWRGQDAEGRTLAPGVYSLRLVAPDRENTRKLIKVR